jgi:hypothetical protein
LVEPVTLKQKALAFIRWRKANGYEVAPFKRQFWGKKAWKQHRPIKV